MGIMDYFYNSVDLENVPDDDGRGGRRGRNHTHEASVPRGDGDEYPRYERRGEEYAAATRAPAPDKRIAPRAYGELRSEPVRQAPPLTYAKPPTSLAEVLVYSPQGYEDVQGLIDYLKNGTPIIVDLHAMKEATAQRILDFLSGAIYAVDGAVLKLQSCMFLLTPAGINIAT